MSRPYRMRNGTGQVRDPKGVPLHATLLRVLETDERGRPTMTRLCHDDETIGLVGEGRNVFIVVWAPASLTMYPKRMGAEPAKGTPAASLAEARAGQLAELQKVNAELLDSAQKCARLEERVRIAKWLK